MNKKQVDQFEILQGQLEAFYNEMNTLAKKSPNDALNTFKLALVNSVIEKANRFLGTDKKPFGDFEKFDESAMPSTSDVLVLLSQYLTAFEKLRAENIRTDGIYWYWKGEEELRTAPPKKLKG